MTRMRWVPVLLVAACGASAGALDDAEPSSPAMLAAPDAARATDAADVHAAVDGGLEAARPGEVTAGWAQYVIAPGAHAATLVKGTDGNPIAGLVNGVDGRDYELAFDPSAMYAIARPTQPDDQLDWNKLPGVSDCGTFDLARDGVMFGWRWRLDTNPEVLEVTAYANNARTHLTPAAPMVVLDAADLASAAPLRYRFSMDGALYRFSITGVVRGRAIDADATLPRRCATMDAKALTVQWAAGLYFGGTSTSPSTITAKIFE
jgi:hypothetical protein